MAKRVVCLAHAGLSGTSTIRQAQCGRALVQLGTDTFVIKLSVSTKASISCQNLFLFTRLECRAAVGGLGSHTMSVATQ